MKNFTGFLFLTAFGEKNVPSVASLKALHSLVDHCFKLDSPFILLISPSLLISLIPVFTVWTSARSPMLYKQNILSLFLSFGTKNGYMQVYYLSNFVSEVNRLITDLCQKTKFSKQLNNVG